MTAAARFIDPMVLARIDNLDLLARRVVDGFISGLHRAAQLGVSTDFAEHRAYTPGDDIRRIDWRVFARTDRLYIKTFEAETNADVVFALDCSASMGFASGGLSKFDYARFTVASLVHLASRQRDRIGFSAFTDQLLEPIPPSARHRDTVLRTLDRLTAAGPGDLSTALARLGQSLGRRGVVVVVSDFYEQPQRVAGALDQLRIRGQDVIALHILDPLERDLDLGGTLVLEDLESGQRLPVAPQAIREEYRQLVEAHITALGQACGARQTDYGQFTTDQPLDRILFHYLSDRVRLTRVR
ncbi:MAG: DUF58 domain-containing protein [Candidatus Competibacteraceae bacterium]|nr:DUF58 domain-containing protein [Candidatus Competibacteraceae bacterium]